MTVWHSHEDKEIQVKAPQQFMADEREMIQVAYPGDIIGLYDPGIYALGDTLCEGKRRFRFAKIPIFAPENFARIRPLDSMKRKQFLKGIAQLSCEGAIQLYYRDEPALKKRCAAWWAPCSLTCYPTAESEYGVDLLLDNMPALYPGRRKPQGCK